MKSSIIFLALLMPLVAAAGDQSFDARVKQADLVESSPDGKAYQKLLWKQVGDYTAKTMQQCFPKGVTADTDVFTLVGNVGKDRKLHNIEVRPATPMSRCFANAFASASFPPPPDAFEVGGMPLVVNMQIKP